MSIRSYFRIALGAVGLISTCFATMNRSLTNGAEQVWKEYVYKAEGFAVTAPKQPRERDWEYGRVFEFGLDPGLDLQLEVSIPNRNCVEFEYWVTNHGSSRMRKLMMVAGHTALEQWGQPRNGPRRVFTRAVCISSTMYIFAGSCKTDAPGTEIDEPWPEPITRIMDSFRVVERESPGGSSKLD